jgi:hypothetical protein
VCTSAKYCGAAEKQDCRPRASGDPCQRSDHDG